LGTNAKEKTVPIRFEGLAEGFLPIDRDIYGDGYCSLLDVTTGEPLGSISVKKIHPTTGTLFELTQKSGHRFPEPRTYMVVGHYWLNAFRTAEEQVTYLAEREADPDFDEKQGRLPSFVQLLLEPMEIQEWLNLSEKRVISLREYTPGSNRSATPRGQSG
jgi:hypothetical protein